MYVKFLMCFYILYLAVNVLCSCMSECDIASIRFFRNCWILLQCNQGVLKKSLSTTYSSSFFMPYAVVQFLQQNLSNPFLIVKKSLFVWYPISWCHHCIFILEIMQLTHCLCNFNAVNVLWWSSIFCLPIDIRPTYFCLVRLRKLKSKETRPN